MDEIVQLGFLDPLAEGAVLVEAVQVLVIHQENRTAFQTRASALSE